MSNINPTLLKNFIIENIKGSLDKREAADLGMENEYAELAEDLDVDEIDIEDFSDAILEKFAIAYNTEADKKTEAKDKEKQKEDDIAVKDKNGAGV